MKITKKANNINIIAEVVISMIHLESIMYLPSFNASITSKYLLLDVIIKNIPIIANNIPLMRASKFTNATPTPINVTPVLNQAKKVLSFAKWSLAKLPVFSIVFIKKS